MKEQKSGTIIKAGSTIKSCTCEHIFQDKRYGKKKRVHTVGNKGNFCTVCNRMN